MNTKEMFELPDGTLTKDPGEAAEAWSKAFYEAKDVLREYAFALEKSLYGKPVRNLDETILRGNRVLLLGS